MLHITNGDSVIYTWKAAGLEGDLLSWRDVLHEGPVPAGLTLSALRDVRAGFLAGAFDADRKAVEAELRDRDEKLVAFGLQDEVVLWFEHDLYDQLQLIQILDFFSSQPLGRTQLTLIDADDYLGTMAPAVLLRWMEKRRPVLDQDLYVAHQAWTAFTAPEPSMLRDLLFADTATLPFLRPALLRLCQEYPWVHDGLNRTERQMLEEVASGVTDRFDLFRRCQTQEEAVFMGDTTFFWYLDRMRDAVTPLVHEQQGQWTLTTAGREVLAGRADWLAFHDSDRWIGGVHLQAGKPLWRWEDARQQFVS